MLTKANAYLPHIISPFEVLDQVLVVGGKLKKKRVVIGYVMNFISIRSALSLTRKVRDAAKSSCPSFDAPPRLHSPSLTSIRLCPAHDVLSDRFTRSTAHQCARSMSDAVVVTQTDDVTNKTI